MQLIEHLAEKTYFHTHQIVAYVQAEFGIRYTVAGMNKWLHHHNATRLRTSGMFIRISSRLFQYRSGIGFSVSFFWKNKPFPTIP
ncbi:winged helix-turn-helix domain-containing protein, partial [Vibrio vulnificus]|uniref:winged helix-turn-helix domain-containing protein n=1 Tax=Vibrio vulnificus TaxID=672 RepID=UPI003EDA321C